MSADAPHIEYFSLGAWPIKIGCTHSKKCFNKEMKRLAIDDPPDWLGETGSACCHRIHRKKQGDTIIFITLGDVGDCSVTEIAAMVAHEAVHAAQFVFETAGERDPGVETVAYLVQYITLHALMRLRPKDFP